jgi:EAL domain-containing protein (putative c-di-GMP-specific phosphodiesterase class I)
VQVSLDDFGTGQSSLAILHICPVDEIKLDRSFVTSHVPASTPDVAAAVAHMANALGLRVVAEGVETAEQADRLHQLGYLLAQGYHLARPMSPEHICAIADATRTSATAPTPD